MNRNQWFVLGIGLILVSSYFSYISFFDECVKYEENNLKIKGLYIYNFSQQPPYNLDQWIISCFEQNAILSQLRIILGAFGFLFVILGFLEPKKKV